LEQCDTTLLASIECQLHQSLFRDLYWQLEHFCDTAFAARLAACVEDFILTGANLTG
jgi:hypothetical protein